MPVKIINGFPLRLCSWSCTPIVCTARTRRMMRWLDLVCLKQTTLKVCGCSYGVSQPNRVSTNGR
jgi:hypothetical protein